MPSPSSRLDDQGAGFVVLPAHFLAHPDLTDCDIRVLLALDQMAWREGSRDGVVQASNKMIGDRIGKSASTVTASLRRIEAVRPPIVARDMSSSHSRDSIRLCYDRYGNACLTVPHESTVRIAPTTAGVSEISATPVTAYQKSPEDVAVVTAKGGVSEISLRVGVSEYSATLPIKRILLLPPPPGEVSEISATPAELDATGTPGPTAPSHATAPRAPGTLAELIAWLPAISDDAKAIARLHRLIPLWHARLTARCPAHAAALVDWITDALIKSCEKKDVVTYAQWLLGQWAGLGGRPDEELAREAAQRLASEAAAAGTTNLPSAPATPLLGAPRPSHADRTRAELARIKEGFRQNKLRKEAIDAQSP